MAEKIADCIVYICIWEYQLQWTTGQHESMLHTKDLKHTSENTFPKTILPLITSLNIYFSPSCLAKGSNLKMQPTIKALKVIIYQSSIFLVFNEKESYLCTHNEETEI